MKRKQMMAAILAAGMVSTGALGERHISALEASPVYAESEAVTESAEQVGEQQAEKAAAGESKEGQTERQTEAQTAYQEETKMPTDTAQMREEESESAQEKESEVPEGETEQQSEQQSEQQTEESPHWICRITQIAPKEERIYDGTDQLVLQWQVETEYVGGEVPEGEVWPENAVDCVARLDSPDAGERTAYYTCTLNAQAPKGAVLESGSGELTVLVKPRPLSITLPDGWKFYHDEAKLSKVHLDGAVQVEGWRLDERGQQIIPEGYRAPEVAINEKALRTNTPLYKEEKQKSKKDDDQKETINKVEQALILARTKDGKLSGDPGSSNYVFDEAHVSGGTVTIRKAPVIRGKDYQIEGPAGLSYEDGAGIWWIRPGAGLSLRVLDGSGYTDAQWMPDGQGVLLRYRKEKLLADSLPFPVQRREDGTAPAYSLTLTGGTVQDGICYVRDTATIALSSPQDAESGIAQTSYVVERDGIAAGSGTFMQGAVIPVGETEGEVRISASAFDHVGNEKRQTSRLICVDKTLPEITVDGVEAKGDVRGEVNVQVRLQDAHLDRRSIAATLTGKYSGAVLRGKMHFGKGYVLVDFPQLDRAKDDRYTLQVLAQDKAGNRASKTMSFTLNREGAVYTLGEETQQNLSWYWHRETFPVVLQETNLSTVKSSRLLCIRDGKTRVIRQEDGLQVSAVQRKDGKWQITYDAPAKLFAEEGEYTVILLTEDAAGGSSDSAAQKLAIRFGIDRSAPTGVITGIREKQIIRGDWATLCADVQDNLALAGLRIRIAGQTVMEVGESALRESGGVVKYQIEAAHSWQDIVVTAWDKAGNVWEKKIPVYIGGEEKVPSYLWERGLFRWIRRLLRLLGALLRSARR